jgi:hypothetical protein
MIRPLCGCQKFALFSAVDHDQSVRDQENMKKNWMLIVAEILVMGGILTAFVAPLFVPSPAVEVKQ